MKNGALLFLGLFAALSFSWAGIVLGSYRQLGALPPYYDEGQSQAFPSGVAGAASQGNLVYRDLNCASCHTQQVRREGFGADQARGWGSRQSVARDYIYQLYPQIGQSRIGPDLANLAGRNSNGTQLAELLYAGRGGMPAYAFLFETRRISGAASDEALKLTGADAPPAGFEVVPTPRARALVAYLQSLNSAYNYPETRPAGGAAEPAAAAKPTEPAKPAAPAPAAAPAAKPAEAKK